MNKEHFQKTSIILYAVSALTIDEALRCKEEGSSETILLAFSGHGHFDLAAYDAYLAGTLVDYEYPEERIGAALTQLPEVSL